MIKKALPFLIVTFVFLVASCGTSAAPKSNYASGMAPAVEQLSKWRLHWDEFEALLTEPSDGQNGMSRIEMIDLYNMATGYKISRDDYVNMGFLPLDVLVGDANKFAREGQGLIDTLSALTPDEEIQATHQAVLKCIQTRVAFAEEISTSIRDLDPVDLSGDTSSCNAFASDVEKLTTYVNEHK